MFCKWCGGTLSPSDVKCSRCGKEVPPLSDCGGFYDLMPSAGRNRDAAPVQKMEPKPAAHAPQRGAQAPKPRKKKAGRGYICLTLLVFALIFALLIVLFSKVNQLTETIEELEDELHSVSEQEAHDDEKPSSKKDSRGDTTDPEPKASEEEGKPTEAPTTEASNAEPAPSEEEGKPTEVTTTEPTTESENPKPDGEEE